MARLGRLGTIVALALWGVGCSVGSADEEQVLETPPDPPVVQGEAAGVLSAVQTVLDAINLGDPDLLASVMQPEALIVAVRPGAPPAVSTLQEMAAGLGAAAGRYTERVWSPEVDVQGPIASVWAPYDFYLDGAFSHCGVDAFHLVQGEGGWRVQSLVYNTLQPPDCPLHPDGPPGN